MMRYFRIFSIVFCAITALSSASYSDSPPKLVPAEFVQKVVAAYNSHNLDNFLPLFHPDYAKCINETNKEKFAYGIWWGRNTDSITADFTFNEEPVDAKMAEVNDETKNPYAKFQQYPAIPDTNLRVSYAPKPSASFSKLFPIKWEKDGNPYIVFGCPTQAGIEEFDRKMTATRELHEKATQSWNVLDEKTRKELKDSIKAGQSLAAQKTLQEKHGLPMNESNAIARMIEDGSL
jgi:hypothetical protein